MSIFCPVFCRERQNRAQAATLAVGATTGTASESLAGFTPGQHLFVAVRNTYGNAEYLGKIKSVAGSTITFEFPVQVARNLLATAHDFFTPGVVWQASDVRGTGATVTSYESGIETLDTTGKELLHTRIREAREYVEFALRDIKAADWQAYRQWVIMETLGGLYNFMVAYMDHDVGKRRCDVVKFRSPGQALRAAERAKVLRSWVTELQIVQRDLYVP